MKKIRRQRPVKGGRNQLPSCVLKEIDDAVTEEAKIFGVSKSFVIATALAHVFRIRKQERYDERDRGKVLHMRRRTG